MSLESSSHVFAVRRKLSLRLSLHVDLAQIIHFSNIGTRMAQDRVSRHHVEIKIRDCNLLDVIFGSKPLSFSPSWFDLRWWIFEVAFS